MDKKMDPRESPHSITYQWGSPTKARVGFKKYPEENHLHKPFSIFFAGHRNDKQHYEQTESNRQ
jgi:hypothetical protein